jgi:NAD(P)-dependent dehydrogenase (short-subunit alcohol dehydrogenase family)
MYTLEGRKRIVTGSGGGIGRAIALRLARAGCDVGIFDPTSRVCTRGRDEKPVNAGVFDGPANLWC